MKCLVVLCVTTLWAYVPIICVVSWILIVLCTGFELLVLSISLSVVAFFISMILTLIDSIFPLLPSLGVECFCTCDIKYSPLYCCSLYICLSFWNLLLSSDLFASCKLVCSLIHHFPISLFSWVKIKVSFRRISLTFSDHSWLKKARA